MLQGFFGFDEAVRSGFEQVRVVIKVDRNRRRRSR